MTQMENNRTQSEIIEQIVRKFPYMEGKLKAQDDRRIFSDFIPQEEFHRLLLFLHDEMGMTRGHNIIGTDEGEDLGFIYLISGSENIIIALKTKAPKSDPRLPSLSWLYPSFVLFERELVDLFGAIVTDLPEGPHYPLPDGWPSDQWPLRKEWKPGCFNRETLEYNSTDSGKDTK